MKFKKNKVILLFLLQFLTHNFPQNILNFPLSIDFDKSMGRAVTFGFHGSFDKLWFEFWRFLYENNNLSRIISRDEPFVPYIIHQIWLGSEFPQEYREFQLSWQLLHPGWLYILWTDQMVEALQLHNKSLYDVAINYGQKSDIARYEILYRFGGLYADTDFRCLKPFTILHHCYDFYIGICNTGTADLAIGLIGAKPHHPILKEVIETIKPLKQITTYHDVLLATGNLHFMQAFMKIAPYYRDGKIITFPCSFFYPLPNNQRHLSRQEMDAYIKPESFAIHYWECSWQKPQAFVKTNH